MEYLYIPSVRVPYDDYLAETRRWVQEIPIVRKTAKRIYYNVGDRWDLSEVVKLGYIDRQVFERDGKIRIPGDRHRFDGWQFFATREAAEDDLYRWEREHPPADLRELRMAMADAHPDRGGTSEAFIAARQRYERALGQAS